MKNHIRNQHERVGFSSCEFCEKTFNTRRAFQNHIARIHPDQTKEENFVKCEFCNIAVTKQAAANHRRSHLKPQPKSFKCTTEDCAYITDSDYKLKQHIDGIHLQLRPFKCDICHAAFKRSAHLATHQ